MWSPAQGLPSLPLPGPQNWAKGPAYPAGALRL